MRDHRLTESFCLVVLQGSESDKLAGFCACQGLPVTHVNIQVFSDGVSLRAMDMSQHMVKPGSVMPPMLRLVEQGLKV
jgi:hypothetical protein